MSEGKNSLVGKHEIKFIEEGGAVYARDLTDGVEKLWFVKDFVTLEIKVGTVFSVDENGEMKICS